MMNIVLCGFMGCGKTTVGKYLAKLTGKKFVDTDELIEAEQGVSISEIFETKGEDYFRGLEYEICKKAGEMRNAVISTGGGAMTFKRNADAIRKNSKIIFINASFDVICSRIGDGETRPLFKNKANAKKLFDERKAKYQAAADYTVNGDRTPAEISHLITELFK